MNEKRFKGNANWTVRVIGLQYIFKALIIIAEILLYMITVPNSLCDTEWFNLKKRATMRKITCRDCGHTKEGYK